MPFIHHVLFGVGCQFLKITTWLSAKYGAKKLKKIKYPIKIGSFQKSRPCNSIESLGLFREQFHVGGILFLQKSTTSAGWIGADNQMTSLQHLRQVKIQLFLVNSKASKIAGFAILQWRTCVMAQPFTHPLSHWWNSHGSFIYIFIFLPKDTMTWSQSQRWNHSPLLLEKQSPTFFTPRTGFIETLF